METTCSGRLVSGDVNGLMSVHNYLYVCVFGGRWRRDFVLSVYQMIKGKVEKAELRTEMAKIQTRKASIVSDTFVLALKRVS